MRPWLWGSALVLVGAVAVASPLPGPLEMILIAVSVFVLLKIECLAEFLSGGRSVSHRERFLWFVAWLGFEAARFFSEEKTAASPSPREWILATSKMLFGFALWIGASPVVLKWNEMAGGWTPINSCSMWPGLSMPCRRFRRLCRAIRRK